MVLVFPVLMIHKSVFSEVNMQLGQKRLIWD